MPVGGQNVSDAYLLHHDETRAVSERIAVIGVLAKKGFGRFKTFLTNPNQPKSLTPLDNLQEPKRSIRAASRLGLHALFP